MTLGSVSDNTKPIMEDSEMKHLILVAAVLLSGFAIAPQEADAQVRVRAPFVSVNVGNNRGFNRFDDRGIFRRAAINQAIRKDAQADFLRAQAQLLQAQQLAQFNRRNDLALAQQIALANQLQFNHNLGLTRGLQQYNDLGALRLFNQSAYIDPREAALLRAAALNQFNNIHSFSRFSAGGHCR